MSEAFRRVPLSIAEVLKRSKLPGQRVAATEAIRSASVRRQLLEDYRPMAESLEWQLASLRWMREVTLPFVPDAVYRQQQRMAFERFGGVAVRELRGCSAGSPCWNWCRNRLSTISKLARLRRPTRPSRSVLECRWLRVSWRLFACDSFKNTSTRRRVVLGAAFPAPGARRLPIGGRLPTCPT